jgi:type III secretion protein U
MGEKSEKATPKKLRDARKKGQVAKSQDFPAVFTFVTSVSLVLAMSASLYDQLSAHLVSMFSLIGSKDVSRVLIPAMGEAIMVIANASLPILAMTVFVGVVVGFLTVGPTFSTEVFKPDIKKFNPVQNLKAKFKMKTLVELLKSMLKITIAGYVVYSIMYDSLPVLTTAVKLPMLAAMNILYYFTMEVVVKVGLIFFVIAVFDLAYQKYTFANEMKMEKFEIKQEYKNSEGDPQIKGKRKEIAREIAYGEGSGGGVKKSKAVVTNPTHIAVAIGYERELDPCPYILEMGKDLFAAQMIKVAEEYKIPVIRNIPLARKLYEQGEVYAYVPQDTYEAIATILKWIQALENGEYRELEFDE